MKNTLLTLAMIGVILSCAFAKASAATVDHDQRLFEMYSSSGTSQPHKKMIKRMMDERERKRKKIDLVMSRRKNKITGPPAIVERSVRTRIWPGAGGVVRRSDGASVAVPPGSLGKDVLISIAAPTDAMESVLRERMEQGGLRAASIPVAFGPEGTVLRPPATITLAYDLGRLGGVRELDIHLYAWDAAKSVWEPLASEVDVAGKRVSALTGRLTVFQVMGKKDETD